MTPRRLLSPRESDFTSTLRGPEVASRVGVWLGDCFSVAFLTGLFSHFHQDQLAWLPMPTRPVWIYQVTQGLHVIAGTAAIPLLLVKLWSVFPKLFGNVPWQDVRALVVHLLERLSIAVLVAAAIFQLATGIANSTQWYPWAFSFRSTHFAVAWIAIGALIVHIAVKLPKIRNALTRPISSGEKASSGLSRRGLFRTALGASAVAVVSTAGSSVPWLRDISVFGVRSGNGPAGVPINKSAQAAGVTASAMAPSYTLSVSHGDRTVQLTRADLEQMPQHTATLPISCVEGWSASGTWGGVRLRDLLERVGVPGGTSVRVVSVQKSGAFREAEVPANFADDPLTLVALRLNGEGLSIDHGYPCRLIAPGRPGVLQTKWLHRVEA